MSQVPMTVKGAEALREELKQRKQEDRPKIIQAIAEAHPEVFFAAGTHPMSAADEPMVTLDELIAAFGS